MDPATIGAIVGGVGQVAGAFGKKGTSRKREFDSYILQSRASREDIPLRVEAYKDAGIHPLYGLAGQQFQPSPTNIDGGDSVGERLAMAGQGIARAASAFTTKKERAKQELVDTLSLERMQLENDLLRSQITTINRPTTPGLPSLDDALLAIDGQAQSHAFEAGISPDVGLARSQSGLAAVVPSDAVKQRIEDMFIPEIQWYLRQLQGDAPKGYGYDPFTSEYFPANERSFRASFKSWKDRSALSPWRKY